MSLSDRVVNRVVIGMDPHKRSATIEVMAGDETVLGGGRFDTDRAGFAAMVAYVKQWPNRVWAIEGCHGIGRHIANRLLADAEQVVDVPPKLSARARVFVTGQGRKTDATDAQSVALVGTRVSGLRSGALIASEARSGAPRWMCVPQFIDTSSGPRRSRVTPDFRW